MCFSHFKIPRCQQFWVNKEHFGRKQVSLTYTALNNPFHPFYEAFYHQDKWSKRITLFHLMSCTDVVLFKKKSMFFKELACAVMWLLNTATVLLKRQHGWHIKCEEFASASNISALKVNYSLLCCILIKWF